MSPGRAAIIGLLKVRQNGGLGDRFRALAWNELLLPTHAPLVASLVGALRV